MMTLMDLAALLLLGCFVYYWWQARDAKAFALQYVAQRCRVLGVQLLDQSIVLRRIRLRRDEQGLLNWVRHYDFEFSSTGDERYAGTVVIHGHRLLNIEMAPYLTPEE